ncbi:LD-carboxypeptidase [Cellulomonas oligotrophica]|uniref:LD-carboxypeptidase n=1 Tax=Cellulomonas oligotrophica TaxID=931536 RepID=A0A7Y9FHA6_9CELL|nr:LD-carboxypeptidase [Cellulomonas oligotrophica]NYD87341.1 muramoyltetrapeptide carboxypeptidase LdcA involved in peptidoglycan recycling [Cellulomonas oligotrophica]GIG34260.1 LD-carboxypeptidase [Cellulomonas oligotrophica]
MIRYPQPLVGGDVVGVAAPSSGVAEALGARLDVAEQHVRDHGLVVREGPLVRRGGIVSGTVRQRVDELTGLMTDPAVRAVVPPWGGELALDLLGHLDLDALGADPTWLVGFSDISTLLLPLTLRTGVATLHGQNLMDTPYRVPAPMVHWLDVVRAAPGATVVQGAARRYRGGPFADYATDPGVDEYVLDAPGGWTRVDAAGPDAPVHATGRLVGGCLETVAHLAGTPFGDVDAFAREHAPEGLVVYLESAESGSADVTRRLLGLRYAGWFDHATAVLIGRTTGRETPEWTHHHAARHALGDLGIPVLVDVDCGHVPPHLALVNGALATVDHGPDGSTITQVLA